MKNIIRLQDVGARDLHIVTERPTTEPKLKSGFLPVSVSVWGFGGTVLSLSYDRRERETERGRERDGGGERDTQRQRHTEGGEVAEGRKGGEAPRERGWRKGGRD